MPTGTGMEELTIDSGVTGCAYAMVRISGDWESTAMLTVVLACTDLTSDNEDPCD
jgi:hypothetical protein